MKKLEMITLFDYNYWARDRILAAAARVSAADYAAPTGQNYGSLRGTLVHTFDAEYSWRLLLMRNLFTPEQTEADLPTLEGLVMRWREEETAMRKYLGSISDQDLMGTLRYTTEEGKRERVIWHCLLHVVNHGTQHRSEAAYFLTQLGQSPGELDFTVFLNSRLPSGT